MRYSRCFAASAALVVCALAGQAGARPALPFSTGFEAAQGYTSGSQLATNPNWTGDGQDTTGWQVTNSTVGGSAAASGSQWVLTSGATASVSKFQWAVAPVTDFTLNPAMIGSADVKFASPAAGSVNRTTIAGVAMYTAAIDFIGGLSIIVDAENLLGGGVNQMYAELDGGGGTEDSFIYDLGVTNQLNTYFNLKVVSDFTGGLVYGFINGVQLPDAVTTGGAADFHDFDMVLSSTSTSGGTRARGGFDNYSIAQGAVPAPGATVLLAGMIGGLGARRRRS